MKRLCLAFTLLAAAVGCDRASSTDAKGTASSASAVGPVASAVAPRSAPSAAAEATKFDPALVRETKSVLVDGVTETWRLVWGSAPKPACADASWSSCDCKAFAFAETGPLSVVRSRPGHPDESFDLGTVEAKGTLPRIRKTEPLATDKGKQPTQAELEKRPAAEVMKLGDYDGDGQATEFVYTESDRRGIDKCGAVRAVVIGVSKANAKLHAFQDTVVEESKTFVVPLNLDPESWETMRTKKQLSTASWGCDHGATTHPVTVIAPRKPAAAGATEFFDTKKEEPCK